VRPLPFGVSDHEFADIGGDVGAERCFRWCVQGGAMMRNAGGIAALCGALVALCGCNENGGLAGPTVTAPVVVSSFHLPAGAPCSKEIDTYENILKSDLDTGNVEQKVYDEIQHELARAAAACSAGKGGESHSIVASSKQRHGYRA
jgi:hypothetical protein